MRSSIIPMADVGGCWKNLRHHLADGRLNDSRFRASLTPVWIYEARPDNFVEERISGPLTIHNIGRLNSSKVKCFLKCFRPCYHLIPNATNTLRHEKRVHINMDQDRFQ